MILGAMFGAAIGPGRQRQGVIGRRSTGQHVRMFESLENRVMMAVSAVGAETLVNSFSNNGSTQIQNAIDQPVVSVAPNGNFVIGYRNVTTSTGGTEFNVQRFGANGTGSNEEIVVNPNVAGSGSSGLALSNNNSSFAIAYQGTGSGDADVFHRLFNGNISLFNETSAAQTVSGNQSNSSVAMNSSGEYIVVWSSADGVFLRRFSNIGQGIGDDIRLDNATSGTDTFTASTPVIASDASGNLAVTWVSDRRNAGNFADRSVLINRLDSTGTATGTATTVFTTTDQSAPLTPAVALGGNGTAWVLLNNGGSGLTLYRLNSSNALVGNPIAVTTAASGQTISNASIDADNNGNAVLVWLQQASGNTTAQVLGQRFLNGGSGDGAIFTVNSGTSNFNASSPSVSVASNGNFVVAWNADSTGGSDQVFFRRYSVQGGGGGGGSGTTGQVNLTTTINALPTGTILVPGSRVTIPVTVTNAGTDRVAASTVSLYASTGDTLDTSTATLLGSAKVGALRSGASQNLRINTTVPGALNAGNYRVFAVADSTGVITETNETDNVSSTSNTAEVSLSFGRINNRTQKLVLTDAQGITSTFSLSGPGVATVTRNDAGQYVLAVTGTTDRSSMSITTKAPRGTPAANIMTPIAGITTTGDLRSITGKNVDLLGGINIAGGLATLNVHDILTGNQLLQIGTPSTNAIRNLTINASTVRDASLNADMPIQRLNVLEWLDTDDVVDVINARSLNTLNVAGNRRSNIAGNFNADVNLTDVTARTSMNSARIAGTLNNSNIRAVSSIGSVQAAAVNNSNVFAGVSPTTTGLPTASTDFVSNQAINNFTVNPGRGVTTPTFTNSNVAAQKIGTVRLANVSSDNAGTTFGIASGGVNRYSRTSSTGNINRPAQTTPGIADQSTDYVLNIIGPSSTV